MGFGGGVSNMLDPFHFFLPDQSQSAPPAPAVPAPAVMPTPDDEAVKAAKRKSIAMQMSRSGRDSTILTPPGGDKLGG